MKKLIRHKIKILASILLTYLSLQFAVLYKRAHVDPKDEEQTKHIVLPKTLNLTLPEDTSTSASAIKAIPTTVDTASNIDEYNLTLIFDCDLSPSHGQVALSQSSKIAMCGCFPRDLKSYTPFAESGQERSYKALRKKHPSVKNGQWNPTDCVPRHKVAVVVPYRDREDHLVTFLDVIHGIFQKQKLNYTLFVVEQANPKIFNKGRLMNAGFIESMKMTDFDCIIFHDIDLLPEDERNLYTCPRTVRHQGLAIHKYKYKPIWNAFIGGVAVFSKETYTRVNGFPNSMWGWGGEDDNMYRRVARQRIKVESPPWGLAKYHMLEHSHDDGNPANRDRFKLRKSDLNVTGISNAKYRVLVHRPKQLYRWLLLDVSD